MTLLQLCRPLSLSVLHLGICESYLACASLFICGGRSDNCDFCTPPMYYSCFTIMMLGAHHSAACFLLVLSCQCMQCTRDRCAQPALSYVSDGLYDFVYVYAFCSKISEFSICCLMIQHVVPLVLYYYPSCSTLI